MRLHILGICGTFMSGLAILAKESGYEISGSDINIYPPMSMQLFKHNIEVFDGYDPSHIKPNIDAVIVGNVIKRGNPAMEYVMANDVPYYSGPDWLFQNILKNRYVIGIAGTHGKTTTTSLLSWILEHAGFHPGFLIGGVPENFGVSARLGNSAYFVIEADEYDSAFFDKRPKFMHYHPKLMILNNLEYDHADIFTNLEAIKQQFHYLIKTIPGNGRLIYQGKDVNLSDVVNRGCWTPTTTFGDIKSEWMAESILEDGSQFSVLQHGQVLGKVEWGLLGKHNMDNALAAIAVAKQLHIPLEKALSACESFKNVKRRLEVKGMAKEITIYDDFAHHPTAIATTLAGLRAKIGKARMIAVIEFASYTMRAGLHKESIADALKLADMVICKSTILDWGLKDILAKFKQPTSIYDDINELVLGLTPQLQAGDHVIVMSNSAFDDVHKKLIDAIEKGL